MEYQIKEIENKYILVKVGNEIGYLKYSKDEYDNYIIESIFISEEYRGKSYAKIIFDEFINKVEKENKKVIPVCSYAQKQFEKREDIRHILK